MEAIIIVIFSFILLSCILAGYSILWALLFGYLMFFGYALRQGHTPAQVLTMSGRGIRTIKNILFIFILIGMITAVWRACGTIPFIIYHMSGLLIPSVFILIVFLLCCFVSLLTGTSFGTAATIGIICMSIAKANGIDPTFTGGAILSGIYFGDRCSPMSTSALLISELTQTDIYCNIKNMFKSALLPFSVTCLLYALLGFSGTGNTGTADLYSLFPQNFDLHWTTTIPALLIIVLSLCKVKVRLTMAASIITGSLLCLFLQDITPPQLGSIMFYGFYPADQQLAQILSGGGIISMFTVSVIIILSSAYAGIFEATGFLNTTQARLAQLGEKITPYGSILLTATITSMATCNQTLSSILTYQLHKDSADNMQQLALDLENSTIVVAALIPWSIACAVPLTTVGADNASILFAFYLYLLPLYNLWRPYKVTPV